VVPEFFYPTPHFGSCDPAYVQKVSAVGMVCVIDIPLAASITYNGFLVPKLEPYESRLIANTIKRQSHAIRKRVVVSVPSGPRCPRAELEPDDHCRVRNSELDQAAGIFLRVVVAQLNRA
jgi:hypothetical protein